MNKFTTFSADSLGWIGLGLSGLSFPATGWLGIALATTGLLLCVASLIARFYITGYRKGKREADRAYTDGYRLGHSHGTGRFQAKTFREGASK